MKLKVGTQLALVLIPLALLSLGTSKARTNDEAGVGVATGDPLAGDGAKLVGDWSGADVIMHVGADKSFFYEHKGAGVTKKYEGKLKEVQPSKLVINALIDVSLDVQKMPTDVDGYTVMTVDGNEMYKGGLGGNLAALITQKFKVDGVKKTTCPTTVTEAATTIDCTATVTNFDAITDAGTDRQLGVLVQKSDDKNDYNFMIQSGNIAGPKAAEIIPKQMGPYAITDANCGPTTLWLDAGASFECAAVDSKTKKNLKITITTPTTATTFIFTPIRVDSRARCLDFARRGRADLRREPAAAARPCEARAAARGSDRVLAGSVDSQPRRRRALRARGRLAPRVVVDAEPRVAVDHDRDRDRVSVRPRMHGDVRLDRRRRGAAHVRVRALRASASVAPRPEGPTRLCRCRSRRARSRRRRRRSTSRRLAARTGRVTR